MRLLQSAALGLAVALCAASSSAAEPQVSDRFIKLSRAVARLVLDEQLRKHCDDKASELDKADCHAVVDGVAEVFAAVISGSFSVETLRGIALRLASRVASSAAMHELASKTEKPFDEAVLAAATTKTDVCKAAISGLRLQVVSCGYAAMAQRPTTLCEKSFEALRSTATACGLPAPSPDASLGAPRQVLVTVAAWVEMEQGVEPPKGMLLGYLLRRLERQLTFAEHAGAFERAWDFVSIEDEGGLPIDSISGYGLFNKDRTALVARAKAAGCKGPILEKLSAWNSKRRAVYAEVIGGLSAMDVARPSVKASLAEIPSDLDGFECADTAVKADVEKVAKVGARFGPELQLLRDVEKLTWSLLLVAPLIDYLQTQDQMALERASRLVLLRAAARAIAAREGASPVSCEPVRGRVHECKPLVGGGAAEQIDVPTDVTDMADFVVRHFEQRGTLRSARKTCSYQLIAALVDDSAASGFHRCRMDPDAAEVLRLLGVQLDTDPSSAHLRLWTATLLKAARERALTEGAVRDASQAVSVILAAASREAERSNSATEALSAFARGYQLVAARRSAGIGNGALRAVLSSAAGELLGYARRFLDEKIAVSSSCEAGEKEATSPGCIARALAEALFEPAVGYLTEVDPTKRDPSALSNKVLKAVSDVDPLSSSVFLVNLGLGASAAYSLQTPTKAAETTWHFTVIEKFGLAYRCGQRNQYELGVFVGGFADPILRKLAGEDEVDARWQFGAVAGIRQFSKSFPLGLELHVGGAAPFTFDRPTYPTAGLVLLVPLELALDE